MFHTIIVGGGIAGVAAGQCLIENGEENFLLLESEGEIGGRVSSVEFAGVTFSSGPGWIHGFQDNPIYDIMESLGIELLLCDYEDAYFVWDVIKGEDVTNIFKEKSILLQEVFQEVSVKLENVHIDAKESVEDILRKYSHIFPLESDIDKVAMFVNKEIYMGAPLSAVSAIGDFQLDNIYSPDDEDNINFRIIDPQGGSKMIEHLSKDFKNKIKTNNKVKTILWDKETHVAQIITENESEFKCKNVIITLQSSLLAKNVITFDPKLPVEKETAWRYVPSVNYCRIFAKFSRQFWPDKEWLISVTKDVDPFNELIIWQNCFKQNLCSENDNILICHFTSGYNGNCKKFNVNKETLSKLITESMKNMFPSTYCAPDDVRFLSHCNNDRFSGSYSVAAPGLDQNMVTSLEESVGPIHFAGESVSVELLGTMQAAYLTGRRAAQSALKKL